MQRIKAAISIFLTRLFFFYIRLGLVVGLSLRPFFVRPRDFILSKR